MLIPEVKIPNKQLEVTSWGTEADLSCVSQSNVTIFVVWLPHRVAMRRFLPGEILDHISHGPQVRASLVSALFFAVFLPQWKATWLHALACHCPAKHLQWRSQLAISERIPRVGVKPRVGIWKLLNGVRTWRLYRFSCPFLVLDMHSLVPGKNTSPWMHFRDKSWVSMAMLVV